MRFGHVSQSLPRSCWAQALTYPATAGTVCFGYCYGGQLAAYMRRLYPNQCHAALASSPQVSDWAGTRQRPTWAAVQSVSSADSARCNVPSAGHVSDARRALPADQLWQFCGENWNSRTLSPRALAALLLPAAMLAEPARLPLACTLPF